MRTFKRGVFTGRNMEMFGSIDNYCYVRSIAYRFIIECKKEAAIRLDRLASFYMEWYILLFYAEHIVFLARFRLGMLAIGISQQAGADAHIIAFHAPGF